MEWKCKKCNSTQENLYIQSKGTQTGLYCRNCGNWLKWLNKKEIRTAYIDGILFVGTSAKLKLYKNNLDDNLDYLQEYKKLLRFKEYFDELYGQGLQVANWNMNGTLVDFDDFYDSAEEYMEEIKDEF